MNRRRGGVMAWSIARAASLTKLRLHLSSSPIPPHRNPSTALLLSGNPRRSSSLKILRNYVGLASPVYAQRFRSVFSMQKMIGRSFHLSGRKLFTGTFIGISILGGMLHRPSNIAYAMDDFADYEEPSGYLKDDLNTFWALTRKFQLPVVLFFMVFLGWRRPVTLAINIIHLLFFSYLFYLIPQYTVAYRTSKPCRVKVLEQLSSSRRMKPKRVSEKRTTGKAKGGRECDSIPFIFVTEKKWAYY